MHGLDEPDVPPQDEPLRDVMIRLVEDGKTYARAELNRQKIRAAELGAEFRTITILIGIAAALVAAALIALIVGLLIALAPIVGPWGATGVVVGVTLAIAFSLLIVARNRFRRLGGNEKS